MIPELWNELGTEKIGDLNDCLECFVEEERNGIFELTLDYPNGYPLADQLLKEKIIVANANDTLLNQKFRIYDTKKFINETITVFARHISFDLMYDYVGDVTFENQSCEYALNSLFRQSQFSKHYRGYSDIVNAQNYSMSMCNILEAIGGKEGSIIDTFGTGAEILRDNTDIHVLNARGHDNGVTIEYGKNLTGFELTEDTTDLVTRILPYAKYTSEGGKETIVKGNFVDSPLINNYSHPYIKHIDYTDKFKDKEVPTKEKLETFARNEYRDNKVDIPKTNFKIEFIPLSKCVGYEELEDKISICDKVTIKNTRYNVDTKAKVIKYKFDVLKDRYDSMELGEPRTTLGDIIGNSGSGEDGKPGPQGPQGEPGPQGPPGNIGDFPDSLPSTPVLSAKVYGFASIELSWTYENKVYYNYELYASKTKDFTPNVFDLIHAGQTSSFLFQAKPNETWYFKVCAINSHGNRTEFSSQISVTTTKIDNLSNYVDNMAIGDALIGELNLGRGWFGQLKGNYIDAKQLSVTDGNGKRTLDIDSFGNVNLDVTELKINSKNVAQTEWVQSQFKVYNDSINESVEKVANSGTSNLVPFSYFKDHFTIKKHWFLNGVTWFEDGDRIGIQNIYNANGNIISEGKVVNGRIVSLYTDLDVEANITAKIHLVGSKTDKLQYDWALDAISYTKNERGGKKLEGIVIPDYVKTLFFQVSNLGEGTTTHNVVWINKINLVDGYIAKSGDLFDVNQSAQLSIDAQGIKTEVEKKVDNDSIISSINQSAENVKILAKFLELTGYATFKDLSSPGTTTIDGRNIKTGFIEAIQLIAPHITGKSRMYLEQGSVFSSDGETNVKNFYGMPGGTFDVESEATFGSIVNSPRFRCNGNYVPYSKSGYKWVIESLQGIGVGSGDAIEFQMVGGTKFGVDLWYIGTSSLGDLTTKVENSPGIDVINQLRYSDKGALLRSSASVLEYKDSSIPNEFTYEIEQDNGEVIRQVSPRLILPHVTLAIQQQDEKIKKLEERIAKLEGNPLNMSKYIIK